MALRIVATLAATGLVAACGFKGPLYLPPPEDGAPAQPEQQQPAPIPPTTTLP
ncbi:MULTISPECIES: LPS translocon maturation chaperone LptM [Bordetella]|uniref:Lipoprotein n=1 Tax=Bordetella petrii TaxID=94624 RepID=A0ABT7W1F9_9BORD|nr:MULTISPECIES: lipoprotein [Bordetella]MDM9559021.1 lipoprotein [Bordetella petrii]